MTTTPSNGLSSAPAPVILLGAGASVEAGVPTARGMVYELFKRLRNRGGSRIADIVEFIWKRLEDRYEERMAPVRRHNETATWRFAAEPDAPDVESLLRALDRLAGRHTDELGAFAAGWDHALDRLAPRARDFSECRKALEHALAERTWLPETADVGYLMPILTRASIANPLTVATLNYDNTVELATRQSGLRFGYGFERDNPASDRSLAETFDVVRPEVRLLKLHGSANWVSRNMRTVALDSPNDDLPWSVPTPTRIHVLRDGEVLGSNSRPALIFGQSQKLSAEFPYFETFLAFREALSVSISCLVIGYSFRDAHVNALLRSWFTTQRARELAIIEPYWNGAVRARFHTALGLAPTEGSMDRCRLIEKNASEGIREFFGG